MLYSSMPQWDLSHLSTKMAHCWPQKPLNDEDIAAALSSNKQLGFVNGKISVWIMYNYSLGSRSAMVELCLKALGHHADARLFDIQLVNNSNVHQFIPDLPTEWARLPDFGSKSDLLRAGLLAHHGGVYLDGDVLLACGLAGMTSLLQDADLVSYAAQGQNCGSGDFSSNAMAIRPGSKLAVRWWVEVIGVTKKSCLFDMGLHCPFRLVCRI